MSLKGESFQDIRSLLNNEKPVEAPHLYHILNRKLLENAPIYYDQILPYVMGSRFSIEGSKTMIDIERAVQCHDLCPKIPISLAIYEPDTFQNLAELNHFNITELEAMGQDIKDLSPIANMSSLKTLHLDENLISDISPLSGLIHLEELTLSNNRVEDVGPLRAMNNMIEMDLAYNLIEDVTPLSGLTNIVYFSLEGNKIKDFSSLSHLRSRYRAGGQWTR